MTTRVSIGHDGQMQSEELASRKVSRSSDYESTGFTVQDGFGTKSVTSSDQLRGDEIVHVAGMSMKASQARELGLLDKAIDESLSMGAAQNAARENAKVRDTKTMGHEGFDATAAELNKSIEEGLITLDEGIDYENSIGEIALSGLTVTEITTTLDGLADGSVHEMDVNSNTRQVAEAVETKVTAAATTSAMAELGRDHFDRLAQITASNPEVNAALRQYASLRALGRADATWTEFLADVDDHLAGIR